MSAETPTMPEGSTTESVQAEALQLEVLLSARTYLYELFHKFFGAVPDDELIDALLGETTANVVEEYATDDETMRGLINFLSSLAVRSDRSTLVEDARDEYTRLFIGPGALPALFWESPYRTHETTVFQENTLDVRRTYREYGWEAKRIQRIPDDHVALLCAFMEKQAREALGAFRSEKENELPGMLRRQRAFVDEHLNNWLGTFAKSIRRSKTAVLYPQLVEALASFARLDAVFLNEAAFWLEEHATEKCCDAALSNSAEAEAIACVDAARVRLEALRLVGIDDCELVGVD